MFGTRRFMDEVPMLGRPVFQSLGQQAPIATAPAAASTASASVPPVAPERTCTAARVGTVLATLGVGFFALEVTGITNVMGIRKYLR